MELNGEILGAKTVSDMARCQMPGCDKGCWGYGVRVIQKDTDPYLPEGTFGWSGAYGTHFWIDPANEITALFFKNSLYDGGSDATTDRAFEEDVYSRKVR